MSEQKRYTAQEMRDQAEFISTERGGVMLETAAMLRQAADAEEENAKLRVDADLYKGASENWERKYRSAEARLEAVVKECEHFESMIARHGTLYQAEASNIYNAILRAARGEGGVK